MPVPKKRHSNIRQGKRRFSNYTLENVPTTACPECGGVMLPHHACPSCGKYRGRQVVKLKTKKAKKG
ncbi:MAG: 50S ribosomal protein L32 [Candidatus Margulisiibacteriota bacterium]